MRRPISGERPRRGRQIAQRLSLRRKDGQSDRRKTLRADAVRTSCGAGTRPAPARRLDIEAYGIAYRGGEPRPELVDAAARAASSALPNPAVDVDRYGLGFLGIHDGRDSNFVFVCWWQKENELQHRVFFSTPELPGRLRPATQEAPIACVWDLSVIAHEREAWIRHMLAEPGAFNAEAYLADALSGEI